MKIIKVEYFAFNGKDGEHLCDIEHCYCEWETYGYYSKDYKIEKLILKIMNDRQDWNMENISISEITLNKLPICSKDITNKYKIKVEEI